MMVAPLTLRLNFTYNQCTSVGINRFVDYHLVSPFPVGPQMRETRTNDTKTIGRKGARTEKFGNRRFAIANLTCDGTA